MSERTAALVARHVGGDRVAIAVRGHELIADQPLDAGGEDAGPTPTEVFLAGLAACVTFYAGRFLRRHDLSTEGLVVACDYTCAAEPARVGAITLAIDAPGLPQERSEAFRRVVEHCSVHNTLRFPPEVRFEFRRSLAGIS